MTAGRVWAGRPGGRRTEAPSNRRMDGRMQRHSRVFLTFFLFYWKK
jgi:hypothetical protein